MKNIRNIVCFAFVAGLALTACREDEQLDLAGYPGTGIGMGMVGEEEPVQAKMLRASYDSEGRLSVDGELTRSYTFTLAEASPEDLVLALEPVAVNVPAEKVELSAQEVRIPAGYRTSEAVEVKWLDEDFSFAAPDSEARTYEIGVRVAAMSGHKPAFSGEQEGKVVVEKEAYLSTFRLEPAGPVSFTRSYAQGKILNAEPMRTTFRAVLDRPALAEIRIAIVSTGIPEEFASTESIAPAELVIPAGAKSSDEAVWTVEDDFLLTSDQAGRYPVVLAGELLGEDATVAPDEEGGLEIDIVKETYTANLSLVGPAGNAIEFRRNYSGGVIVDEEPMTVRFKVQLDKAAVEDVRIAISSEGLPAAFAGDETIAPQVLTIPAGAAESEEATWTVTDDFLCTNSDPEDYTIMLSVAPERDTPYITLVEGASELTINVHKVANSFSQSLDKPEGFDSWVHIKDIPSSNITSNCSASYSSFWSVLRGSAYSYVSAYANTYLDFDVDLGEEKDIIGFEVGGYYDVSRYKLPSLITVYSSADGVNWSQMGEIPLAEMNVLISYAYFSSPQRTRYFKLTTPVNPGPGVWYLGAFKLYTK